MQNVWDTKNVTLEFLAEFFFTFSNYHKNTFYAFSDSLKIINNELHRTINNNSIRDNPTTGFVLGEIFWFLQKNLKITKNVKKI